MSLFTKKNLFFFFFNLGLLLLLLLSETYLGLYIVAFLSLLWLFGLRLFPVKKTVDSVFVFLTLFILGVFGLSLFTTLSFPLSLYGFTRFLFLFATFLFFLRTHFSFTEKKTFLYSFLLQGTVLVCVAAFFFIFPEYGNKVPGMNLIFSTYGHNHLGAVMLLVNPITVWLYARYKTPVFFLLFLLFCLAMVLSFGRTVIFIGLAQLALFFILYQKQKIFSLSPAIKWGVTILCSFFLIVLAAYVYSATSGECLFGDVTYEDKICKTELGKNVRYYYWQQGMSAFLENPLWGYGIGTFGSLSTLFRQIPDYQSTYVHNDYLQILAETGLFGGGAFIALFLVLGYYAVRRWSDFTSFFLPISVLSLMVDIFFDFDLHFLSIALIFFILFSLIHDRPISRYQFDATRLQHIIIGALLAVLGICVMYMTVDRLITFKKEEAAYKIFPYFHWHTLSFLSSEQLSLEQKEKVVRAHSSSRLVQSQWIELLKGKQKADAEYASWRVDPWRRTSSFLPQYYFDEEDFDSLEIVMNDIWHFLDERLLKYGFEKYSIPFNTKQQWSQYFIALAERAFEKKEYANSAEYLRRAYYFNEWSLAPKNSFFSSLYAEGFQPEWGPFFANIQAIPTEAFGDNREQFSRLIFQYTKQLLRENEDDHSLEQTAWYMLEMSESDSRWFQEEIFMSLDSDFWQRFVEEENWGGFYRHALLLHALQTYPYQFQESYDMYYYQFFTRQLVSPLQQYVDFQQNQKNEDSVSELLDSIVPGVSGEAGMYWWQAQRGYWYGLIGDDLRAQQAFRECLEVNPNHDDCKHGLTNLLEKGEPDIQRYYEIREILLEL